MACLRRNKVEVGLHLVWTTFERRPLLTPDIEEPVFRCVEAEARKLNCTLLALNGMPDHVHLAVLFPTTVTIAKLAQQVKGVSSTVARDLVGTAGYFSWAAGYGVFAFPLSHRGRVVRYIEGQKEHHATKELWDGWEEPDTLIET